MSTFDPNQNIKGTTISSPIGRVHRPPQSPQKIFTVDDPRDPRDQNMQNPQNELDELGLPRSVQRQPHLKHSQIIQGIAERPIVEEQRFSPQKKRALEAILGIGRITKDVTVDNVVFKLRSLNSRENNTLVNIPRKYSKMENAGYDIIFEMRAYTLACSICEIDGIPFSDILNGADPLDAIYELDENLSALLYREYQNMIKEGRALYGLNTEDNSETPSQNSTEEIISDIKK